MAIESIAKTLGSGSGIDISALVSSLVDAQYATKQATLDKKSETLTAQISAAATLKSNIATFDSSLKTLINGGSLSTQATSSNTAIVKASALPGASVAGFTGNIEVRALAAAQVTSSGLIADKNAAIGSGSLRLTFGTGTVTDGAMTGFAAGSAAPIDITIPANSSLQDIATAINAKKAGATASILTDSSGSRLVLKGNTGEAQAFTLDATGSPGLDALEVGVGASGTTIGSAAQDAVVAVDGVAVKRSTNTIGDLFVGVKLELQSASVGTKVTLGTQTPTQALGQAVNDFVDTYNELMTSLKEATDPVNGPLKSDNAARTLLRSLKSMTTATLASGLAAGEPTSLAGIGVATQRDGTLKVDTATLGTALINHGGAIEAMFKNGTGLSAALGAVSSSASSRDYGLGASETRYNAQKSDLAETKEKALASAESMRTRMTRQFASMDSAVASYKSTQDFLTNQIAAWNKDS
ncbi:MAG: flagellar filament capping protein FliD [Pseudomonadota bacterium]